MVGSYAVGAAFLVLFGLWERRAPAPMLPLRFFRSRAFAATSGVSLAMSFGIFGSIFLLAQYFQTVKGYGPLEAGLRTLPWTGMPMLVAPIAGAMSDRIGSRPLMAAGLGAAGRSRSCGWPRSRLDRRRLQRRSSPPSCSAAPAWRWSSRPSRTRSSARCKPHEAGQASGANNAIRELGGVLGVAVLAAVFSSAGGYESGEAFVDGLRVGAVGRRGGAGRRRRGGAAGAGARAVARPGGGPGAPCRSRPENGELLR